VRSVFQAKWRTGSRKENASNKRSVFKRSGEPVRVKKTRQTRSETFLSEAVVGLLEAALLKQKSNSVDQ
jgi:hypothetical protein